MNITFLGEVVHHSIPRVVRAASLIFGLVVLLPVAIVVSIPLHILLRLLGRRGFMTRNTDGSIEWNADGRGFGRAP